MTRSALERELRAAFGAFIPPVPAAPTTAIATDDDLRQYVADHFGVRVPCVAVCPDHASPWAAFCDAYFARSPVSVWKASRGFGGKSFTLALLSLVEALTLQADVSVLGGSGEQSQRVLEAMTTLWAAPGAPRAALASDPAQRQTRLVAGNSVRALMASQTSVRGPHPQRLRLDEIDEMDLAILDAAMGQSMSRRGVLSQTVLSSTHQYPEGPMTTVLRRAQDKNWRVFEWCWKETCEPHGWLPLSEIARKRTQVTDAMWRTEYDLQEPSPDGRAIDPAKVERMFMGPLIEGVGDEFPYREFDPPVHGASYATGADWARLRDSVAIATFRDDVIPLRLVAYQQFRRKPTPYILQQFEYQTARYPGRAAHDATGGGGYLDDFLADPVEPFVMVGMRRRELFTQYVMAVEHEEIIAPRVDVLYRHHKFCRTADLWSTAGHPPDGVVAAALAYHASRAVNPPLRLLNASSAPPQRELPIESGLRRALDFLRRHDDGGHD
jgi:hypothetical protein